MYSSRGRWRPAGGFALSSVLLLAGCRAAGEPWPEAPQTPWAEIVVDFTRAGQGRVPVAMTFEGISGRDVVFVHTSPEGEYTLHEVGFEDGAGRTISHVRKDNAFRLAEFEGQTVKGHWVVEPGGQGRHGHQGMIADDWATFDGRLYLMPSGAADLRDVRIRYEIPEGWSAGTPFREQDGWHYLDTLGGSMTQTQLENACVGVGRFETRSRTMGAMEVRVSAYAGWSDELRERLFDSTFRLMQFYYDRMGFDLGAPYAVVWTPAWNNDRVHGGAHVNGTCLQNPDHRTRSFQLLSHRLAHSMNKYPPVGMKMLDAESSWFKEGWPSYMEVHATEAVGIVDETSYLASLYSSYLGAVDDPERDMALIDEPSAQGQTVEYVHYTKGPLVVQMLDELIQRRSGNDLQHYMREIWAEHSGFRSPFAIKATLEEMTGASLDAFWQSQVHERGQIVPCWKEFVTESMQASGEDVPAGRVGDSACSVEYLHHLVVSGEFDSMDEVAGFLVEEEARRRQLGARGLQMCPDSLLPHLAIVPPQVRRAVVRLESAQLPKPERDPTLKFTAGTEPAVAGLRRLFEQDARYRTRVASGAIRAVEATTDESPEQPLMGFSTGGAVKLRVDWRGKPRPATLILRADGNERHRRELTAAEAAAPIVIEPVHRPLDEAMIEVELDLAGEAPVTRAFWQRDVQRGDANQMSAKERRDPASWHTWALVLQSKKQYAEALDALERAILLAPDQLRSHFTMATIYTGIQRYPEAVASYDEVLRINPAYPAAIGGRADALAASGESAAALAAIENLMNEHATFAGRLLWQGRVFDRLQRRDEAAVAYGRYTELMPKQIEGWTLLGDALSALGRAEEAVEAYGRALTLNPKNEDLRRRRSAELEAVRAPSRRP